MTPDEILSEALSLSEDARLKMAEELVESLREPAADPAVVADALQQLDDIRKGKIETLAREDVFGTLRNKLNAG